MRLSLLTLAVLAASGQAFKDTSPFLLFSSSALPNSLNDASIRQVQSSSEVLPYLKEFLKGCPSDIYYVVSQPEISATELATSSTLKKLSSDESLKTRVTVSEVVGLKGTEGEELVQFIKETCGATRSEGFKPISSESVVVWKDFPVLGSTWFEREVALGEHGSFIYGAIQKDLPKNSKYTLIYLTTPSNIPHPSPLDAPEVIYESDFNDALHMDLKRNLAPEGENRTIPDQRPLFEKYQFFSPGLFMGLLVGFILLSILSVGISAISSLQVSYGAFDKESGPPAPKQQQ